MNKVLVLHFTHPEGYPPALNAINCISENVDTLKVITTDTLPTKWKYKENVNFEFIEGEHNRFDFVNRSRLTKLKRYYKFILSIRKSIKKDKPTLIITYDNITFLFYLIASLLLKRNYDLWNHNHDIYPANHYVKYSISWFSYLAIQRFFNRIDYFSIPALERKKMFPMQTFKGKFFFIPNYPSKKIINNQINRGKDWTNEKFLRLIYPGSPSVKNGFEELIDIMNNQINGKRITLTIVGETNEQYRKELNRYAKSNGVENQLFFKSRVPYTEMPLFLRDYHIGWAMYKPEDMRTETVGTASNKIYEFLANGMPIIVLDNEHHKEHLSDSDATFFCDLAADSIIQILEDIDKEYAYLSKTAVNEFDKKYQFEQNFKKAMDEILN